MHLRVVKEEPQEAYQQNLNTKLAKKELQKFEHQRSNPIVVKEKIKNQDSRVDVKGQLGKVAKD
jgi:hypothetical protein